MIKNVGTIDRTIRIVAGLALIAYAVFGGVVWGYIGVVPLVTGLVGWCPAYCPFKLSTAGGCGCSATGCEKK